MSIPNSNIDSRLGLITRGSGLFAILVSLGVLQIWLVELIFNPFGNLLNLSTTILPQISIFAFLCLLFSGICILLLSPLTSGKKNIKTYSKIVTILATLIIVCALVLFMQTLLTLQSNPDGISSPALSMGSIPNMMTIPINLTLCFLLFGVGLMTIDKETAEGQRPAQYMGFVIFILSFFTLLGVVYEFIFFDYSFAYMFTVGLIAVSLMVLASGIFCARPDQGILAILRSESSGGVLARHLFPSAIMIPALLGGLIFLGLQAGYYDAILGLALLSVTQIIIFQMIFWRNSLLIHNLDSERAEAKEALRKANEQLSDRVKKQTAEIESKTKKLTQEMTARQKVQEALSQQTETNNRLKDEFLAVISHELRSPLNSILGWATMLKAGKLDAEMSAKAIDIIERSARSQNLLINDLLDISMMISGKTRLQIAPIKPQIFISNAIESLRPAAEEKGLILRQNFQADIKQISGDQERLQQVVRNLIANAIKFTPSGGEIEVNLRNRNNRVLISVTDTGLGIAPNFLPYVFDRFRQADSSHTRKHGGLGLGLSIVRHLVELHGGVVGVESRGEGKGSTFYFELPQSSKNEPKVIKPVVRLNGAELSENANTRQEMYI